MKVSTTRFGVMEVDDSRAINLVRGLCGFELQNRYTLIQQRPGMKFRWLQSLDEPGLAFVVIEPSAFFPNYEFEISSADAEKIHLKNPEDALALAIVTIGRDGREVTANLAAPIVINSKEMIGAQVIVQDNYYSIRQRLVEQRVRESEAPHDTSSGKIKSKAA